MLTKDDLVDYMASGCKPRQKWRMGMEHEQFVSDARTGRPLAYDGQPGIRQVLESIAGRYGWQKKFEGDNLIALSKDNQSITLEPAGQIELSGAPQPTIAALVGEHQAYSEELKAIAKDLDIAYLSAGVHPNWSREDMHWMPKKRYDIMRRYLPTRGDLALDMMTRTCGAQINLDFESECDMVAKLRVSTALQPFIIALFANSAVVEGKDSGYASYRAHIWSDTDPDRCGVWPFIFEDGMGFERYVDYMLDDVPMFLIQREGHMIDMAGKSFRDYLNGQLQENALYTPDISDWEDHIGTAFPEVRLKKYLELRGPDSVSAPLLYALAAFWVGLLYEPGILQDAQGLISNWTISDHLSFRESVAQYGLETRVPNTKVTMRDFAPVIIDLAASGLEKLSEQKDGLVYLENLKAQLK